MLNKKNRFVITEINSAYAKRSYII